VSFCLTIDTFQDLIPYMSCHPPSAAMDHTTPIPVALCCKDPKLARSVCEQLLPDLDGPSPHLSILFTPLLPPSPPPS
jgi:hypothetical protein